MLFQIFHCCWDKNAQDAPTSHELLRRVLECYLRREVESFTVCSDTPHGKPYVAELPDVHFSISHAGGYWVCAVGGAEVGLDLQDFRKIDYEHIAKRFFHPTEIEWLKGRGETDFFRIWARKESYVKFTGEGLSRGLDYFSVVEGLPAWQWEVPFKGGYQMVVTAAEPAEVILRKLK